MQNKQIEVIRQIKKLLKEKGYRVGIYPEDVSQIGEVFPTVMISDENEVYDTKSGGRIEYHYQIGLYLYTRASDRIKSSLDNQTDVMDTILNDQTLSGKSVLIYPLSVEKGTYQDSMNWYEIGIYRNIDIRKIIMEVVIYDER